MFDLALNLPLAFLSNYPEIPDSCLTYQFTLFKRIDIKTHAGGVIEGLKNNST